MNVSTFVKFFSTEYERSNDLSRGENVILSRFLAQMCAAQDFQKQALDKATYADAEKYLVTKLPINADGVAKVQKAFFTLFNQIGRFKYSLTSLQDLQELEKMAGSDQIRANLKAYSIECSMDKIRHVFKTYGVLQLKECDAKAQELVIGCGQGPAAYGCASEPFNFDGSEDDRDYYLEHLHDNAITVDSQLAVNPHFVAEFGKTAIAPALQEHRFKHVVLEGASIANLYSRLWYRDLLALLDNDGFVTFDWASKVTVSRQSLANRGFSYWSEKLDTIAPDLRPQRDFQECLETLDIIFMSDEKIQVLKELTMNIIEQFPQSVETNELLMAISHTPHLTFRKIIYDLLYNMFDVLQNWSEDFAAKLLFDLRRQLDSICIRGSYYPCP